MTNKTVESAYNKLAVHAKKRSKLQQQFDEACKEQYGFLFNECDFPVFTEPNLQDSDKIIDTLDFGTDCLPFTEFDRLMVEAKRIKSLEEK